ncbi:MAG TPA: glutathione S-transferase family protein, partial [Sphingomonadales bacterium]|nr:glutathione S-transferase family protein [Sphingomonadales bacterium]
LLELDDGTFLSESDAILFYLAKDTGLWSRDPEEQAQILRWMFFEQSRIEASIAVVRYQRHYKNEKERIIPFENELRRRGIEALRVMDDHLENHDFFAANRFTIADIALYAYSHVSGEAGIDLADFPNIREWITRVEERERFIPFTER